MTLLESLLALHAYPLDPEAVCLRVAGRGLPPEEDYSLSVASASAYQLARADVLMLLALAPNVSQEGISYTLPEEARKALRDEAERIYRTHLPPTDPLYPKKKPRYGYRGELLKG